MSLIDHDQHRSAIVIARLPWLSDDDWLEAGAEGVSREAVLEWAAARTDDVRLTESYSPED